MKHEDFFYKCSIDYINSIDPNLYGEISAAIRSLPRRETQSEINNDFFWLLASKGWSYDTVSSVSDIPPNDLALASVERNQLEKQRTYPPK
jgi:hypothetical protein